MDILFFAPESKDVVRAVNEMVGVEVEDQVEETAPIDSRSPFTILCSPTPDIVLTDDVSASPERLQSKTHEKAQSETSSQVSTQATPSRSSVPTTPSKWNMKDLNFESAGFTPDEAAAIKRKIESQKLIAALTSEVKQGLASSPSSKNTPVSTNMIVTPKSTATLTNETPAFPLDGIKPDDQVTVMRKMKLQSLVDALSKEQQNDNIILEGK